MGGTYSRPDNNSQSDKLNGTQHGDNNGAATVKKEPITAFEHFLTGYATSKHRPCIGVRPDADGSYQWKTYDEVLKEVKLIGTYLTKNLGLERGSFIGTLCSNCSELLILELACYAYGLVLVPLYDTLGQEACAHIVTEADLTVIFCKGAQQVNTVLSLADSVSKQYADFTLLTAEKLPDTTDAADEAARFTNTISFATMLADAAQAGEEREEEAAAAAAWKPVDLQPDDLAVICYTSGTTGQPKGVMLNNRNMCSGINTVRNSMLDNKYQNSLTLTNEDVYFSYLPMAHILERMSQLFCLRHGMGIGFFTGDRANLMSDLQACRPTMLSAVPKIVSRIYDAAYAAVSQSKLKSALLDMALNRKFAAASEMQITRSTLWDRIVLHKLQTGLGGRLRFMAIGGAPISPEALRFAKSAFGCLVVQGFGQTETCGIGLCQRPGDPAVDSIGEPMIGCEVKLIDVPDMDYYASDGHGEICIRGPSCFTGYYKQQDKTKETIDEEGWVHTGDIGVLRADGSYRVIDRAKNLFKLAQGEYVAPEKIEMFYSLCPLVEQVFVDGNSEKSFLLGVVVPSKELALRWAANNNNNSNNDNNNNNNNASAKDANADFDSIVTNAQFKQHLLHQMQQMGREKRLHGFEQVKDIVITTEPFTAENDLLTPTLKLKRPQLRKRFADDFAKLYAALEA